MVEVRNSGRSGHGQKINTHWFKEWYHHRRDKKRRRQELKRGSQR